MYYVFSLKFSQTDHEMVIVEAKTENAAKHYLAVNYPTARYIDFRGKTDLLYRAP